MGISTYIYITEVIVHPDTYPEETEERRELEMELQEIEIAIRSDDKLEIELPLTITGKSFVKLHEKDFEVVRNTPVFILQEICNTIGVDDPRFNIVGPFFHVYKGYLPCK